MGQIEIVVSKLSPSSKRKIEKKMKDFSKREGGIEIEYRFFAYSGKMKIVICNLEEQKIELILLRIMKLFNEEDLEQ